MRKKILLKYALIFLPFITGGLLFIFGIFNLFSSILFFVGGYIAIKNTFDYRKVIKNKNSIVIENKIIEKKEYEIRNSEQIMGFKRTIRHPKVRKRIK